MERDSLVGRLGHAANVSPCIIERGGLDLSHNNAIQMRSGLFIDFQEINVENSTHMVEIQIMGVSETLWL